MIFINAITTKGLNLLAKSGAGATITFTKLKTGSGVLSGDPKNATDMIALKQTVDIIKVLALGGGTFKLRTILDNKDLAQGYTFAEYGVYAIDPDLGEILFAYGKATQTDYMPGKNEGHYSYDFSVVFKIDNAANVTIKVESPTIYVSIEDFDNFRLEMEGKIVEVKIELISYIADYVNQIILGLDKRFSASYIDGETFWKWEPSGLFTQGGVTTVNDVIFPIPFDSPPINMTVTPYRGGIQGNPEIRSYEAAKMNVTRAAGKAFWTATGYKKDCPRGISLDKTSLTLNLGETYQLAATIMGVQGAEWTSLDTNVATVDETGKITAVGVGGTLIRATISGGQSALCMVAVREVQL